LFQLGIEETKDTSGNIIKAYDKVRQVCDIIRNKDKIEVQVYAEVIQNYLDGKVILSK